MKNIFLMPVYEDMESFEILLEDLVKHVEDDFEVVAVDDGSIKIPVDPNVFKKVNVAGTVIRLKRNIGHQRAIAVGLSFIADKMPGANCVIMDSDGEDKPEAANIMLSSLGGIEEEAIVSKRKKRIETFRFKLFYFFYRHVFNILSGTEINFGNFMALKPQAVKRLAAMQELWVHVAGCLLVSNLRIKPIPFDRGARYRGKSKMNFNSLVLHGFRGLMVFAEVVLVRVGITCMAIGVLSGVAIFVSIGLKGAGYATPGWFSIALGVLLMFIMQTGALALMSLMLSGVMRSGSVVVDDYKELVDSTISVTP